MGQFWNSYSYGPCNPISGVDPDGMEWDYDNMNSEELAAHYSFLENASGHDLDMYLAIQDDSRLFGHQILSADALNGNSAAFLYSINATLNGPRWDIGYVSGRLTDWTLAHELTHAYDMVLLNKNVFYNGSLNINLEVHAFETQINYMKKAGISLDVHQAAKYYAPFMNQSSYNRARALYDGGYGREGGYSMPPRSSYIIGE